MTPLKLITFLCLFVFAAGLQAQSLTKRIKKKVDNKVVKTADKILKVDEKTENEKTDENKQVVNRDENGRSVPIKNFINGNIVFSDNFNNEKHGEFPSRWTQLSGTMQNAQLVALEKKEGVVQFITSARLKPTFKNDDYLGNSFKIEGQFYFHGKGNEAYTLYLKDKNDIYATYSITIRGDGIVPAGSSHEYARMPYKLPYPGWRTVQLSFNEGIIKVMYQGYQLINIAEFKKTIKKKVKPIKKYTNIEVSALSRSASPAMINYITIAHKGLPLYKKLMSEEGLVEHIKFDNNSYTIQKSSYSALDKVAKMLVANPNTKITIEGHTDANGTNEANRILGQKRADAVKNYLQDRNVAKTRMITLSYGEEKPVDAANTSEAWAMNRRVVFRAQR